MPVVIISPETFVTVCVALGVVAALLKFGFWFNGLPGEAKLAICGFGASILLSLYFWTPLIVVDYSFGALFLFFLYNNKKKRGGILRVEEFRDYIILALLGGLPTILTIGYIVDPGSRPFR
jgi:hypothetical protein